MLQNKIITITSIEQRDNRFIVKDQDDVQYSFFTTKQDGNETQAYNTFLRGNHGGQMSIGTNCQITYKEETKQNNYGKSVTYRTIVSFLGGVQPPAPSGKTPQKPNLSVTEAFESKEAYGKRLAIHGMVNGLLASGMTPFEVKNSLPAVFALEEAIEEALINGKQVLTSVINDETNTIAGVEFPDIPF